MSSQKPDEHQKRAEVLGRIRRRHQSGAVLPEMDRVEPLVYHREDHGCFWGGTGMTRRGLVEDGLPVSRRCILVHKYASVRQTATTTQLDEKPKILRPMV